MIMDPNMHNGSPQTSSGSRKRPRESRENETQSQRQKREKAAERQRRKRERDRQAQASSLGATPYQQQPPEQQPHHQPSQQPQPDFTGQELTPEEAARRDRVRAAARERQRKHRQLVKQRKMRELGLDMGNEIMPGMEEVHYRVNADGQYQQVMPHELQQQHPQQPPPPLPQHHPMGQHEPPFPQGQPLGGQTFASSLLLSFSCTPLLKQHLLRTLQMTNEELASLEPIIADAWDHWDHSRRVHYAEQAAKAGQPSPNMPGPPYQVDINHSANPTQPNPYNPTGNGGDPSTTNEFRARFHRPLIAPFRYGNVEAPSTATASTPTSTSGSGSGHGPPSDPIDPNLASGPNGNPGTSSEGRS